MILVGQQRDQVGVAGQPRVEPRERLGADRGATDVVEPLEDQRRMPARREVGGGDQSVVPAADDRDVVPVGTPWLLADGWGGAEQRSRWQRAWSSPGMPFS